MNQIFPNCKTYSVETTCHPGMNFADLSLHSQHEHTGGKEWTEQVDMDLMALIDEKKLVIDGWERATENRYHAQLEFGNWSNSIAEISDFLEQHIRNDSTIERRKILSIENGYFYMEHGARDYEEDSPDEITIQTTEGRVAFLLFGLHGPYIPLYQEAVDGEYLDKNNLKSLNSYLEEISERGSEESSQQAAGLSGLHDDLERVGVVDHMERGHYQSAILDAFKILEENVREKAGYDTEIYGTDMMHEAFSPDTGPLALGDTHAEKEGYMKLYAGIMQSYRNPASHRSIELNWREARDIILTVNLLLNNLPDDPVTEADDKTA